MVHSQRQSLLRNKADSGISRGTAIGDVGQLFAQHAASQEGTSVFLAYLAYLARNRFSAEPGKFRAKHAKYAKKTRPNLFLSGLTGAASPVLTKITKITKKTSSKSTRGL